MTDTVITGTDEMSVKKPVKKKPVKKDEGLSAFVVADPAPAAAAEPAKPTLSTGDRKHFDACFIDRFNRTAPCTMMRMYSILTYGDGKPVVVEADPSHVTNMWEMFKDNTSGTRDEFIRLVIDAVYVRRSVPISSVEFVDLA